MLHCAKQFIRQCKGEFQLAHFTVVCVSVI